MDFQLRQAKVSDAATLAALCRTVQQLHVEAMPHVYKPFGADNHQLVKWYQEILRDRPAIAFIAEASGLPIGYVLAFTGSSEETAFTYAQKYLHIDQMSVERAWWRRGVGSALMAIILDYARQIKAQTVSLGVSAFNETAIAFYERHNFAATHFTMTQTIG
jgi:ribosomal protein S18 acetylase RimI-like enzyme